MVEVVSAFPEFQNVIYDAKMLRISKLEQLILKAKISGEIKDNIDSSVLAKNILNIGVGVINYLLMRQETDYAISSVGCQYEQLYSLILR